MEQGIGYSNIINTNTFLGMPYLPLICPGLIKAFKFNNQHLILQPLGHKSQLSALNQHPKTIYSYIVIKD